MEKQSKTPSQKTTHLKGVHVEHQVVARYGNLSANSVLKSDTVAVQT